MEHDKLGKNLPSIRSLIIISIGLILVAIITSAFVYAETATVDVSGTSHDIQYIGNGVTVSGVTSDPTWPSLIFSVDVTGNPGTLEVTLDRSFFDSTFQGKDDAYIATDP